MKPVKKDFTKALEEAMMNQSIKLEAFQIDLSSASDIDVHTLLGIQSEGMSVRRVTSEVELYSLFPFKPVSSQTMFR